MRAAAAALAGRDAQISPDVMDDFVDDDCDDEEDDEEDDDDDGDDVVSLHHCCGWRGWQRASFAVLSG